MGSYYGYVKREADSYIDWSAIGTKLNEDLAKVEKDREAKRAAFEEDARKSINFLGENPMGDATSINEYSLRLANDSQNYLLQLQKLVKSGRMKMNDYITKKQNLMDDVTSMYGIMKKYQDRAKQIAERAQKGESQQAEGEIWARAEGFGDFSKTYAHIDPNTGKLWIANKVQNKEGVFTIPDTPSGDLQLVRSLDKVMNTNYDYYDMNGNADKLVKSFGQEIQTIERIANTVNHTGRISELLDITKREIPGLDENDKNALTSFRDAETKLIESQLANNWNVASVLTNSMRGNYSTTLSADEAAKDPTKILLKVVNGAYVPDFNTENGKNQYNEAVKTFRTALRMRYDRQEKTTVTPQEKDVEYERKQIDADINYKNIMARVAEEEARTRRIQAQAAFLTAEEKKANRIAKEAKKLAEKDGKEVDPKKLADSVNLLLGPQKGEDVPSWYVVDDPEKTSSNLIAILKNKLKVQGFTVKGSSSGLFYYDDVIKITPPGLSATTVIDINDTKDWRDVIYTLSDASIYDPEQVDASLLKPTKYEK